MIPFREEQKKKKVLKKLKSCCFKLGDNLRTKNFVWLSFQKKVCIALVGTTLWFLKVMILKRGTWLVVIWEQNNTNSNVIPNCCNFRLNLPSIYVRRKAIVIGRIIWQNDHILQEKFMQEKRGLRVCSTLFM